MARGWRVLDATSFQGVVGGARGRVTFDGRDGSRREVPAEEVAVLLLGSDTQFSTTALHYLAKHDIATLACDWKGVPFAGFYPWAEHGRVAARHIAQAELSLPRRKNAWMQLIRAKIRGQAAVLAERDDLGSEHLRGLAARVRSGDPDNLEAQAARFYWSLLFGEFRRDQGSGDDVNVMLNYGYMVLRGYGVRASLSAGLSPPIGFFHHGRGNYFNLVDDLIEPFRPAIDHVVARFGEGASIRHPSVKADLVSAASQLFSGEGHRIPKVFDDLAQQVGRYVEGDVEKLRVLAWSGPKQAVDANGEE
ncbi:hypothetical protein GCM10027062_14590 [Nocardioides hungaricus]